MFKSMEIQEFPLWKRLRNKRVPLSFDLEITARCNYNCRHCYLNLPAGDVEAKRREMSIEEIRRIASEAARMGAVWCLITGGEPLLRKDFGDIYLLLKRLGLLVSVFTNASLVSPDLAALFRKYPPRDLEVTVYGASKETYERVTRRPGSHSAFQRGLKRLLDQGVKIRFKVMVMRSNIHEFDGMSRFCLECTKDYYRADPFLYLRNDRDPSRNADIRAERLSPGQIIAIGRKERRFSGIAGDAGVTASLHEKAGWGRGLFHCGAGLNSFYVSNDGHFRLCSSLCHPDCVFDLRRGRLEEAWRDFVPGIRKIRSSRAEYVESCGKCRLAMMNLCRWCPAGAHLETGALDKPIEYFCRVARAQADILRGGGKKAGTRRFPERRRGNGQQTV